MLRLERKIYWGGLEIKPNKLYVIEFNDGTQLNGVSIIYDESYEDFIIVTDLFRIVETFTDLCKSEKVVEVWVY